MTTIAQERVEDADEVEWLFDLAFAPGRRALSSYRLRDGVPPVAALCAVARDDPAADAAADAAAYAEAEAAADASGALAAAIRYWPVRIGDSGAPALLLGPVAVHPTRQGEGLGALLIGGTLETAREAGWSRVLLVGDEPYYGRFGFTRDMADGIMFPPPTNPDRVLARALGDRAFDGVAGVVGRW